jgi:tRNA (cytidine/uridine-2'-O-)-methyltransferase
MFDIVLFEPEIPPNTGNIIRLAANTGSRLHLVKPLGFRLSSRALKRAGLDYREIASVTEHRDWQACVLHFDGRRIYALSTSGTRTYSEAAFVPDDVFLFGPETRGLPQETMAGIPGAMRLRLPMRPDSRSLNLANAVAVVVYEAWRQQGFKNGR